MDILNDDAEEELVSIESTEYWKEMEKDRVGNLLAGARLKVKEDRLKYRAEQVGRD